MDRDDIETDNLGIYTPLFTEMGRSTGEEWDMMVFAALKNGFSALCYDGQNFFDTDHPVLDEDVESLATHTTSFFREPAHYDWLESTGLQSVLSYGAGRAHSLTVWSAACSSGQELWSAGMVLEELSAQVQGGLRWNLVGSDISASIVRRASQAVYTSADLSGLSQARRSRFLMRSRKGARIAPAQRVYRIVPELRERASFVQANLIQDLTRDIPLADVVFLRNVLIYFSPPDR